jgi:lipoprotein-anchoring transpeptidase ErfK/SrfK
MTTLRQHLLGIVCMVVVLFPAPALAAGGPTPTPVPTQRASPTPVPAAPTRTPAATLAPTSQPEIAPAEPTSMPEAAPAEPTSVPSTTPITIADDAFSVWHGVVREAGAYRRTAPSSSATIIEELDPGTPIRVDRWVGGSMLYPDVITWGEVDLQDGGGYIFGGSLEGVLPPVVPPPAADLQTLDRAWIDVNLTLDVITVYDTGEPIKMMLTSPGRPGYQTDVGRFSVRSKLPSQTMSGPGYVVPAVPSVEYFYGGEAVHGRYWTLPEVASQSWADIDGDGQIEASADAPVQASATNRGVAFGVPSSHGCLGVDVGAAAWLYGLTSLGTPVDVHY